ncbi:MAG: hypothetical protein H7A34_07160 [bacterium]|nr:hypothetical protein [bacterium]
MATFKSVVEAFEHRMREVAADAETAYRAKALLYPDKAAFDDCMEALTSKISIASGLKDHIFEGKPYLEICISIKFYSKHMKKVKNNG